MSTGPGTSGEPAAPEQAQPRRAGELAECFHDGFEMAGYYSTGAAWMNSDVRGHYLRGANATYLIDPPDGGPRLVTTRAERLPGRAITPREAYLAFEEGHLAGRTRHGPDRSAHSAWVRSQAYAAAHPGVALARSLAAAEAASRARGELAAVRDHTDTLEHVEEELKRVASAQRQAGRTCGTLLDRVFESSDGVRSSLLGLAEPEADDRLRLLREDPAALGTLRPGATREETRAAELAARRWIESERAGEAAKAWAARVTAPYRTARSYAPLQVARSARSALESQARDLERVIAQGAGIDTGDAVARWSALGQEERDLACQAVPDVEHLIARTSPDISALSRDVAQMLEQGRLEPAYRAAMAELTGTEAVLHAAAESREWEDRAWTDAELTLKEHFSNPETLIERLREMEPADLQRLTATLRTEPLALAHPPTPDALEPRLKTVGAAGLRGLLGEIDAAATERQARVVAVAIETWAEARQRGDETRAWAARRVGVASDTPLANVTDAVRSRLAELNETHHKLIESWRQLAPAPTLAQIERRLKGMDPETAALAQSALPELAALPRPAAAPRRPDPSLTQHALAR